MLRDGIFIQDHGKWKHLRKFLSPQFGKGYYRALDFFREHVENLVSLIAQDRSPVDLQPRFFKFTLDTTTALLFGKSIYSLRGDRSESVREFEKSFDIAQQYLVERYRLLDLYWFIGGHQFRRACESVHAFVDRVVEEELLALTEVVQRDPTEYLFLDKIAIRDQLLNILLAGRDTTVCLLSWTLYVKSTL